MRTLTRSHLFGPSLCCALALGCGDDGSSTGGGQMYTTRSSVSDGYTGPLDVVAVPGPGANGLSPGTGPGAVVDGWTVSYNKILVSFGEFTFPEADGSEQVVPSDVVVDLLAVPASGGALAVLDLQRGASSFDFTMPPASDRSAPLTPYTASEDADMMIKGGYSLYVEGVLEKKDGQSCAPGEPGDCAPAPVVSFRWGLQAGASFSGCSDPKATAGISTPVELAVPAVNWLFPAFQIDPATTPLRAQWIADADLDRDGETTLDELAMIKSSALFTAELGYDLSRAPVDIDTALDFLVEQARTIGGHSWGECQSSAPL